MGNTTGINTRQCRNLAVRPVCHDRDLKAPGPTAPAMNFKPVLAAGVLCRIGPVGTTAWSNDPFEARRIDLAEEASLASGASCRDAQA